MLRRGESPMKTPGSPSIKQTIETVTDLSGVVSGAGRFGNTELTGINQSLETPTTKQDFYFTLTRNSDFLSPQFSALASARQGQSFAAVTIHTISGHVVTLSWANVYSVTRADSGKQEISWLATAIAVDGSSSWPILTNWKSLNSPQSSQPRLIQNSLLRR